MTVEEPQGSSPADGATHDLLMGRLRDAAANLHATAEQLNEARAAVYSAAAMELVATERVTTDVEATACDVLVIGDTVVVGHNPTQRIEPFDINTLFSSYTYRGDPATLTRSELPAFLTSEPVLADIGEIHTYYRDAYLESLRIISSRLCAVFNIGGGARRVLWWSLRPGAEPEYGDALGEKYLSAPAPYDFTWQPVSREGLATSNGRGLDLGGVGITFDAGELVFSVVDDIGDTQVALRDPLDEAEQDLADIAVEHARVGDLIVVRVRGYRERTWRHYVVSRLTREVVRDEAVGTSAATLDAAAGIISPGSYHLSGGRRRSYELNAGDWQLAGTELAPNSEDVLYSYHDDDAGMYLLCGYNRVTQQMANPLTCEGWALFDDGTMVVLRETETPSKVHAVSVFRSPFCRPEKYAPDVAHDSFLGRVGNLDLVNVLGECFTLVTDTTRITFNSEAFTALATRARKLLDTNPWVTTEADAAGLRDAVAALLDVASQIVATFDATAAQRRDALGAQRDAAAAVEAYTLAATSKITDVVRFVELVVDGRALRGRLTALAERPHVDTDAVAALDRRVSDAYDTLAAATLERLSGTDAAASFTGRIDELRDAGVSATSSVDATAAVDALSGIATDIGELVDVVSSLGDADPTARTRTLEQLTSLLAAYNAANAEVGARRTALLADEGAEAFTASMALIDQQAASALNAAATAGAVDVALGELSSNLDGLDAQFSGGAEFTAQIAARRNELYTTFMARRDTLISAETARLDQLVANATTALATISDRAATLTNPEQFDGFFATDAMVARVRSTADTLDAAGEGGRASELRTALNSVRQRARLAAVDRAEMYDDAGNLRLGRWSFALNHTPFDVTLSAAGGQGRVGISGTDFDLRFDATERFGEHAARVLSPGGVTHPRLSDATVVAFDTITAHPELVDAADELRAAVVRSGTHVVGVTDHDAAKLHAAAHPLLAGELRYDPTTRIASALLAARSGDSPALQAQLRAASAAGDATFRDALAGRLADAVADAIAPYGLDADTELVLEHLAGGHRHVASAEAGRGADTFQAWAARNEISYTELAPDELALLVADTAEQPVNAQRAAEIAAVLLGVLERGDVDASVHVDGLLGEHTELTVDVDIAYCDYLLWARHERDAATHAQQRRQEFLAEMRATLGIDGLRPAAATGFVRSDLVTDVYLPTVANNLARQIGLSGATQGLLMLISPPGYGKTMLMTYLAERLGYALVKVDGPAIGDQVTSLDPALAPDAASAAELTKLNQAFAMGSNVICYLDDIQHVNPELLSKFIPLCDSTRSIDGVFDGEARTWNLSGKRFVMVMAGNPYTGSGEVMKVPDMLTNRADVFNLGDVAAAHRDTFARSYITNAAAANPTLAPVAAASISDVELLASNPATLDTSALSRAYSPGELNELTAVLANLAAVRDRLLVVNDAYIASANTAEDLRGEPLFGLQGSYRNMVRLAGQVLAAHTPAEIDALVRDHYRTEAQTLGNAAAWNLARLTELFDGDSTDADEFRRRWAESLRSTNPAHTVREGLDRIVDALVCDLPHDDWSAQRHRGGAASTTPDS